jgi:MYXO-CTERM domain-containing protein
MKLGRVRASIVIAYVLLSFTGCGQTGGCSCLAPLPAPIPKDQIIEGGAQVRVTPAGFDKLTAIIPGVINDALAAGFCVGHQSLGLAVATVHVCEKKQCSGGSQKGCGVGVHLDELKMSVPNDTTFRLDAKFDVNVPIPIRVDWPIVSDSNCTLAAALNDGTVRADIGFGTDAQTGELTIKLNGLSNLNISGLSISGCGIIGDILDTVLGFVADVISSQLGNFIVNALTPVIDNIIKGFLPKPLGIEGVLDVGQFLAGIAPGVEAHMETEAVPGGYASLAHSGLSLGMIVGLNTDRDPSTRAADTDSQASWCVPDRKPPDFTGILPKVQARGTFALQPAPEFFGTPDPAQDLAVGLSETVLDLAGHHAVSSGAMCLGVSTTLVPQLNLGTIGILVPSLSDLGNGTGKEPLLLVLRPQYPVDFQIGDGTMDSPRLTVHIVDLEVDFYAFLFERYVRGFTVALTLDLGLNLDFTIDDQGKPAIQPTLLGLDSSAIMVKVHNTEFLDEDPAQLEAVFPTLFDLVVPLLGDALGSIALPDLAGFTLSDLKITKVPTNQDDFLALYATLAPTMAMKQAWAASAPYLPNAQILAQTPVDKPAAPIATSARVVRVDTPAPALIRDAVAARRSTGLPAIELELDTDAPRGTKVEWQWRLGPGLWHEWSSDPRPVLRDRAFAIQGRHTLEVRSRVQGDYQSVDRTPVALPIVIDSVPPRLLVERTLLDDTEAVTFVATDLVSADAALTYAVLGEDDDGPPNWQPSGRFERDELSAIADGRPNLRVLVRDELGNVADERVAMDSLGFHGRAPSSGGCGCRAGGAPSSGSGGSWLLVALAGLAVALTMRARRRGAPPGRGPSRHALLGAGKALGLVAIFSLPACNCSGDPGGNAECALDSDCAAKCGDKLAICDEGECFCKEDITIGNIGMHSDMALAPDGSAWVSAYNKTHGDLVITRVTQAGRIDDKAWEFIDGVPPGPVILPQSKVRGGVRAAGDDVGLYTSVAADATGVPLVAYYDATNGALKFAGKYAGAWVVHTVDAGAPIQPEIGGEEAGRYAALVLTGTDGRPGIAYLAIVAEGVHQRSELRFAQAKVPNPQTTTDWTVTVLESQPVPPLGEGEEPPADLPEATALFITAGRLASGAPVVAWYDRIGGDLKLARGNAQSGAFETPVILDGDGGHDVGWYPSLAIAADDVIHVTYLDAEHDNLLYMNTRDQVIEVVDDGYRVAGQTTDGLDKPEFHVVGDDSGAVLVGGTVAVAYQDATSHELLLAVRQPDGAWKREVVAGDEDPFRGGYGFYASAEPQGGEVVMSTYVIDNHEYDFWVEVFRKAAVIE